MPTASPDPFLQAAIEEAKQGLAEGGIPIGSVLVIDGTMVGRGHNRRVQKGMPSCTRRWTPSRMPVGSRQATTAAPSCTQRCRHAKCVPAPPCFTRFPGSSSAKTTRSADRRYLRFQGVDP